jgi:hypothetical protein
VTGASGGRGVASAVAGGGGGGAVTAGGARPVETPASGPAAEAVIAVPVANVWSAPDAPRDVDGAMTMRSPDPPAWFAALGQRELLDLHGRLETQALMGEPVVVVSERRGWTEVKLPAQPSRKGAGGYPSWVRSEHLRPAVANGSPRARVTSVLAACRTEAGQPVVLSFATSLPIEALPTEAPAGGAAVLLRSPDGSVIEAPAGGAAVLLRSPDGSVIEAPAGGAAVLLRSPDGSVIEPPAESVASVAPTPEAVLRAAWSLLGVAYLWGGCSGFSVDCSGLTHLAHRAAGVLVPRDADDQAAAGSAVPSGQERPGDLVFFARPGEEPHHVAFLSGRGRILHSPGTGRTVQELAVAGTAYEVEMLPGARRYAAPS